MAYILKIFAQEFFRLIICQIALTIICVELNLYVYVFRLLSESAWPIVKKNMQPCVIGSYKMAQNFILSPWVWKRPVNMIKYGWDYENVYGKRDFADINKVSNQLTLN